MMAENKLIAGVLIVIILFFVIGIFIIVPVIGDISTDISNSTTNNSSQEFLSFDNSTPEATAISIARLNEGSNGFEYVTIVSASLTSDGKYWIVNMNDGMDSWVVTVDVKTGMSKENNGRWRSLDELKAIYIADIQAYTSNRGLGDPIKITMGGKEVWKVPVYYIHENDPEQVAYIYVDVATGKSRNDWDYDFYNNASKPEDWLTLKEVDDIINKLSGMYGPQETFKDALRDLYPE
jgi:hypothetical protein